MTVVKYVEDPFFSVQGEGSRTGVLSTWVRFYSCNLNCDGFGQQDPTNRESYVLPYKNIDVTNITSLDQVPLFSCGCDSSHSWSAKFKHLVKRASGEEIAQYVRNLLPNGSFVHPVSGAEIDHVFTGGEPMLQQDAIIDIVEAFILNSDNWPKNITIETNGTQRITAPLRNAIARWQAEYGINVLFSISQKLFNVSGELASKAFKPEVIQQYADIGKSVQLKYVVNNSDAAWDELLANVAIIHDRCGKLPVWIMPVGATYDDQTDSGVIGAIADRAIANGFHVTGRLHVILWGNDQHGR